MCVFSGCLGCKPDSSLTCLIGFVSVIKTLRSKEMLKMRSHHFRWLRDDSMSFRSADTKRFLDAGA